MNDFIDLPHLPECLLGLPLETIHEIHSHTYHAIKADRKQRGEPAGYARTDHLQKVQRGWSHMCQIQPEPQQGTVAIYTAPQPAAPAQGDWQQLAAHLYQAAGAFNMPVRFLDAISAAANGEPFAHMLDDLLPVTENEGGVWDADSGPAQEPILPEGWHIVERLTCFALHQGNEVIALLSGPRAEDNAALLAGLLAQHGAAQPSVPDGWKLVPMDPTKEMREAITSGIRHDHMVSVYQDMLAAAPKFVEEK